MIHVADKNTNSMQKTERKNIGKCQSNAVLNFSRPFGHQKLQKTTKNRQKTFLL
jgi:hypothetical protein